MHQAAGRRQGVIEIGARHYPLFFLLHGAWLASLALLVPANAPLFWPLLLAFVLLQAARLWVIASLGRYWTTRIITLPGAPIVRRGPYRWLRHPNYAIVAAQIAVLPLVFGAWPIALSSVFSVLNTLLLRHRIRLEETAPRTVSASSQVLNAYRRSDCWAASRTCGSELPRAPSRTAR